MSNKQCMTRLQKEYKTLLTEPVPGITAHPTEKSLLEWHYVLQGPVGSEYEGGVYHGKLVFPAKYPFAGPAISMCTPSGRFTPNAKLCLSMSDFHPESWNPMWSCGSILNGLLSFMLDNVSTTGSMASTPEEKAHLAAQSLAYNCKNPAFKKLFPERVEEHAHNLANPPSPRTQATAAAPAAQLAVSEPQPGEEGSAERRDTADSQPQQQQQQQHQDQALAGGSGSLSVQQQQQQCEEEQRQSDLSLSELRIS